MKITLRITKLDKCKPRSRDFDCEVDGVCSPSPVFSCVLVFSIIRYVYYNFPFVPTNFSIFHFWFQYCRNCLFLFCLNFPILSESGTFCFIAKLTNIEAKNIKRKKGKKPFHLNCIHFTKLFIRFQLTLYGKVTTFAIWLLWWLGTSNLLGYSMKRDLDYHLTSDDEDLKRAF